MMNYFDNLTIEKGMYNVEGKNLTQVLEELDPSENYKNTPMENLDAFQRQLKRYDIKVSGKNSDNVEKFFRTSNASALFPEYVARAVRQGMESSNVLKNIVATVTDINGMEYRSITSTIPAMTNDFINESGTIPETLIKTKDNLIKLHKRGRMIVSSYEALRFQRLDLFTVTLKQIGNYIARQQLNDAINILLNGDDNATPCKKISLSGESIGYNDLINLWAELAPNKLTTILASTDMTKSILRMDEMIDGVSGLNFQGTGKMITPLGAEMYHISDATAGTVIGLDKNYALEMVQFGGVLTDYDKLIDKQLEKATISCISGFGKIFPEAAVQLG